MAPTCKIPRTHSAPEFGHSAATASVAHCIMSVCQMLSTAAAVGFATHLMGNWMNSLYCLIRSPSFFSSANSYASSFKCSVTRVPRFSTSPLSSSLTYGMG